MARYVMSDRLSNPSITAGDRGLASQLPANAAVVSQSPAGSPGRRVLTFESDESAVAAMRRRLGDHVIVEPEIIHSKPPHHPAELLGLEQPPVSPSPPAPGATTSLQVTVGGNRGPLAGADVVLALSAASGSEQRESVTDRAGRVRFDFGAGLTPVILAAAPTGGFWSMLVRQPAEPAVVSCPPLPAAVQSLGWWHQELGLDRFEPRRGEGIRIGVVDTGLAPHPDLKGIEDVGAFVDGAHHPDGGGDISNHGTYTCGILAARPDDPAAFGGMAPGARVFSARVFRTATDANQGDLAAAIHFLVHERSVDLINLSLGASERSNIVLDAITDAMDHGTLCICAAGNTAGPVSFPGAFPDAVAVAALGRLGWGPAGSLAASRAPQADDRLGGDQLYLANISAFGAEIDCAAPGVGIIATVPPRPGMPAPFLAMDGTSAASAIVCGALAVLLSKDSAYQAMPRDRSRALRARQVLDGSARSIGLDSKYQGKGVPRLGGT